jgi:protein-S-isoprenylcysteine O-methyltransferase Ste14
MFSGMLTAFTGLAIVILAALAALVVLLVSLWIKIASEEERLRERSGNEYRRYRQDVKALIPGIF